MIAQFHSSIPKVLVVDDNPIDVHMIKLALKRGGFSGEPMVVDDGEPALAILRDQSPAAWEARPDLIIMDLNLKRVDAGDVLAEIRQTESLKNLMVMLLSSSPEDVMRAKTGGADAYFEKPANLKEYLDIGKSIWELFLNRHKLDRQRQARGFAEGSGLA